MPDRDRDDEDAPEPRHPIDPPVADDQKYQVAGRHRSSGATDTGRTSGGGNLGHGEADAAERAEPAPGKDETTESEP